MTPVAAKALLALCVCPPAVMSALVATSPPARHHVMKAVRHAIRRPPAPAQRLAPIAASPVNCVEVAPAEGAGSVGPALSALANYNDVTFGKPDKRATSALGGLVQQPFPMDPRDDIALIGIGAGGGIPLISQFKPGIPAGSPPAISAIPEPSHWVLLSAGFGIAGVALRTRRSTGMPKQVLRTTPSALIG